MPTLRSAEQSARNEMHTAKLAHTDLMGRKHTDEQVRSPCYLHLRIFHYWHMLTFYSKYEVFT